MTSRTLHLTGNPTADELLATDGNALLLGMVLDQQVPMEKAFAGPAVLAERMQTPGRIDVEAIAVMDAEAFAEVCSRRPAIHRFPGAMAKRLQGVCQALVEQYDGSAAELWSTAESGAELLRRVADLPGFGDQKAAIFVALLGKQYGITPPGWQEAAGRYGEPDSRRSVADVVDAESLAEVRATKKAAKAAARASADD